MTNWTKKRERKNEVKARAAEPSHMFTRCRVVGCDKPARAGTGDGLDTYFCRKHSDHYSRHGSPYKGSYTAKEIAPHRKAAVAWLEVNEGDLWVRNAVERVEGLYRAAGPHVEAFRLRGLSPEERARAAWARLRKAKVDPRRVVAAWLAVELVIRADPQAEMKIEFKQVQAAKLVHKLASGTHKRWGEGPGATELHVYPRSRGRVLWHLGMALQEATELLLDHHDLLSILSATPDPQ
ncbi:hypothetical protein ASC75_05495 [Aminobacter sp. DSM 101952]|uniref:hypothetical protein n=1 Tax=Aminobacter sp. DSM 101952 TaxID=2735891 RepID=UPI0006FFBB4D|nr:hypothetical protein [Aminobacter sp. DSM 101952]KQU73113.1 hypothetical protein ASC75_05495 [Aminobacter sp. DSM 101952]